MELNPGQPLRKSRKTGFVPFVAQGKTCLRRIELRRRGIEYGFDGGDQRETEYSEI